MHGLPQSIEDLQDALVRCQDLWWRSPGSGTSPWAKDGPWYLAQGEVGDVKGEYSETLIVNEAGRELRVRKVDSPRPRAALDAAEVAERDRVTGWRELIADPALRRAVWLASAHLWRGEGRVGWTKIARHVGWTKTPDALARACRREMALLVCCLNGWPARRARLLVASDGLIAEPSPPAAIVTVPGEFDAAVHRRFRDRFARQASGGDG